MRILYVIPYFSPVMGGDVYVCSKMAQAMVEMGHKVTIATTDYQIDGEFVKEHEKIGASILVFKCLMNSGLFLFSPSIKRWARENLDHYDIIHLHGFRSYQNSIIVNYSIRYHKPYILQAHGQILRVVARQRQKKLFDRLWGNKILLNATKVFALGNNEADNCLAMGAIKENILIVRNGINPDEYANEPVSGSFRRRHSMGQEKKIVLYLGRLHKQKGVDLLVEAFSLLSQEEREAVLVLAGPDHGTGDEMRRLVESLHLSNRVVITGYLSEPEKREALSDATVFVTPSYYGFPITFAESCHYGVPIITTNRGDVLDWIDGRVGIVTEDSAASLSRAMKQLIRDDALRERMSKEAERLAEREFNLNVIMKNVNDIYLALMERTS